jgi:hypothetical protein
LEFTPHNNLDVKVLDDQFFPNIRQSYLHMVACWRWKPLCNHTCIKTLRWIIDHTDAMKCMVNNEEGECVGVFLPIEVQKYYKLRDLEEMLNTNFVVKFYEFHDVSKLLASWWKEDKKFTNRRNGWYSMVNLKDTYMYLMSLIY